MPLPAVIALRLFACGAFTYLVWRWIGLVGLVVCAPLFGVALARPLLMSAENAVLWIKQLGYRRLSGRHFEHHGKSIDIAEDEDAGRWIRIEDARKVVAGLPNDRVLAKLFPGDVQLGSSSAAARIKAEALDLCLSKATDAGTLRFRLWLQREVILPANERRRRSMRPSGHG